MAGSGGGGAPARDPLQARVLLFRAPLVTSIADISGVLIDFSLARWYLGV